MTAGTPKPEPRHFTPQRVTRSDAGGFLLAPVDQNGRESGDTPSYDYEAVSRRCRELNQAQEGERR